MNNETKINTGEFLKEIENMVNLLPLSTLPAFHLNIKNDVLSKGLLDNNTMMLQGARDYHHCRIQDIKEKNK